MTETEWLAGTDLAKMFACLRERKAGGPRKRLLLGLAVCDRVAGLMPDAGREAVVIAERFAAGLATEAERWRAFETAGEAYEEAMCEGNPPVEAALYCAYRVTQVAAEREFPANWDDDTLAHMAFSAPGAFSWTGTGWDAAVSAAHVSAIADLIRCVFGNPFRPVAFSPAWRTGTAVALARGMWESRDFSAMPVLGDALEDAGCADGAVLAHCRATVAHCRGCWVVDGLFDRAA